MLFEGNVLIISQPRNLRNADEVIVSVMLLVSLLGTSDRLGLNYISVNLADRVVPVMKF